VNRLWRLIEARLEGLPPPPAADAAAPRDVADLELARLTHRSIAATTTALDSFHFNKAVALIREFSNGIEAYRGTNGALLRQALEAVVRMLEPMAPHLAEELWARLGHETLAC